MRRRSKLRILADIIQTVEKGESNVTKIMLEANLPYTRLTRYLEELEGKGMLVRVEEGREVKYRLTRKGREFLKEFRRLQAIAEAFGVEV
ncbi:MAG: winged helix-turn-helix domain-containing protein [Thermofilaceae archaeon]